jgi:hypothetical protein
LVGCLIIAGSGNVSAAKSFKVIIGTALSA